MKTKSKKKPKRMSAKAQMKEIFRRNAHKIIMNYLKLPAYCALFFSLVIFAAPSCDTLKAVYHAGTSSTSVATSDTIINSADKAVQVGKEISRSFIASEKAHRATYAVLGTKPHEFSVWLRQRVADPTQIRPPGSDIPTHFVPRIEGMLLTLISATDTFRDSRTPENEANLKTALATIQDVIAKCQNFNASVATQP